VGRTVLVLGLAAATAARALVSCIDVDGLRGGAPDAGAAAGGDAGLADGSGVRDDPKNCGRVGRDCLGGACENGECRPALLAARMSLPTRMRIVDDTLYWASGGSTPTTGALLSCPLTGCPVGSQGVGIVQGLPLPDIFTFLPNGRYFYGNRGFNGDLGVFPYVDTFRGPMAAQTIWGSKTQTRSPPPMALAPWRSKVLLGTTANIELIDEDGVVGTTPVRANTFNLGDIDVEGDTMAWTEQIGYDDNGTANLCTLTPSATCNDVLTIPGQRLPYAVVTRDGDVFWAGLDAKKGYVRGHLARTDASAVVRVAEDRPSCRHLTLDGPDLLWIEGSELHIAKRDGSAERTLLRDLPLPAMVLASPTAYVILLQSTNEATPNSGNILRLAK